MGLIYHDDKIIGKVVDQRVGRLPRCKPGQMAGVVLDAGTESGLLEHLDIKICALCNPLCFQQLILALEFLNALLQLCLNSGYSAGDILFVHNIMRRGKDCDVL